MTDPATARTGQGEARGIAWHAAGKAALAGIIGTIGFDLMGLMAMGQWWDVPALLGDKIGGGLPSGVIAHYTNGALLAILFAAIAPLFPGPYWLRGILFFTVQTIFGVWLFMMPLVGAGALGLKMGAKMPVMSLLRHWVFGALVGFLYPRWVQA